MNLYKVICEYSESKFEDDTTVTIYVIESTKSGAIKAYLHNTKTKLLETLRQVHVYKVCNKEEIINGASL